MSFLSSNVFLESKVDNQMDDGNGNRIGVLAHACLNSADSVVL